MCCWWCSSGGVTLLRTDLTELQLVQDLLAGRTPTHHVPTHTQRTTSQKKNNTAQEEARRVGQQGARVAASLSLRRATREPARARRAVRTVVLPAASRPTIKIRISFLPMRPLNNLANTEPMMKESERRHGTRAREREASVRGRRAAND